MIREQAQRIAREAGALLLEEYDKPRQINHKGRVDLVTQADGASEQLIVERLQAAFPDHRIVAEEEGEVAGGDLTWYVDPLDGTTNFAHGFPVFAVSMALVQAGEPVVGVIYDPMRDELFAAERGGGAYLNGKAIFVTGAATLEDALIATGFPYDHLTAEDNNTRALSVFLRRVQGLRRAGAAALDMAYVAAGRLDGYWEMRVKPWDVAAGVVLVREAGGMVSTYEGRRTSLFEGEMRIAASNGRIHEEMLDVLKEVYNGG
ncbi:MAG: inositol monophosphatase family protein [Anaerolineae bacterium]